MTQTVINDKPYNDLPEYASDAALAFSDNSLTVLQKRYLRKDSDGNTVETPAGMFYRVAHVVGNAWPEASERDSKVKIFYELLANRFFFPNSPTFTGAGTPLGQLAACFVLPLNDDMGKEDGGIFDTLKNAALIQQTGGGNGFSFSRLRPKGDRIATSGGIATGPIGFLQAFDAAFGVVSQGGVRRGANMAVLRVDHPDIEDFVECKAVEGTIQNFNISVAVTDEFMAAVMNNESFDLVNPRDGSIWKTIDARNLFDKIVKYAHRNGEPGVLFIDRANADNPVPHLYELEATNPCGEQWLGPYENCCLGSINLAHMVTGNGQIDWALLGTVVRESTRFLDCVVTANNYVPAVPELKDAALKARRIGLGVMGLADLLYKIGVRYGSPESQDVAAQIMEFVRFQSICESVSMASRFGAFPEFERSIYADGLHIAKADYSTELHRPVLDWVSLNAAMNKHGLRNAAQTTIAPTGTIATVVGCEGYGCEPVFALGYVRHLKDGDRDVELAYTSPLFEQALDACGLPDADKAKIKHHAATYGTIQDLELAPEHLRHVFVASGDIFAEEHVRMQAALQTFVDNSISKTCNFPEGATPDDVAHAYQLAWELGCKGLTVYVTGSREQVVLETKATQSKKSTAQIVPTPEKQPRPTMLSGHTYKKETPIGTAYITVNEHESEPFEVFLNVGKAGSEVSAVSEALGRMISYALRVPSSLPAKARLRAIIDELIDIGGSRPLGFGTNRVRSLPDGVAQVLRNHLQGDHVNSTAVAEQSPMQVGDICPECGEASFVNIEGCRKCLSCGYSEC